MAKATRDTIMISQKLLNKHDVKYCIVGAFALAFHAEPRYTKDIDIWVQASTENAEKLL